MEKVIDSDYLDKVYHSTVQGRVWDLDCGPLPQIRTYLYINGKWMDAGQANTSDSPIPKHS